MTSLDFEELVCFLVGVGDYQDESEFIEKFEQKYNIMFDDAFALIKDLLPLCMVANSPITKKLYQGFATSDTWLVKRELVQSRVEQ